MDQGCGAVRDHPCARSAVCACSPNAMQGLPSSVAGKAFSRQGLRGHSIFPQKTGPKHNAGTRRAASPPACSCAPAADLNGPSTSGSQPHIPVPQTALRAWKTRPMLRTILRKCRPLRRLSSRDILQKGSPQALAYAAVVMMPQLNGHSAFDLFTRNYVFKAGFWAWLLAQTLKIFTKRFKQGVWDIRAVVDSGGMPSSHSALCTAVTTAVGLEFGLASSLFAVALCFTLITMYDAAGVRYHSGKQAEVLNILLKDVVEGHPVSEQRLKEVLGHTPVQVCCGAILGVCIGLITPAPAAVVL